MERVKRLLAGEKPVKWLFYGDSITHGALHTMGYRDYTELFAERVRFEMARSTDIVINTAISGNTTRQLLNEFDWRVRQFAPHVVFLMIGMNDSASTNSVSLEEFETNLQKICGMILGLPAIPVIQTTCPILPGTAPEREPYFDDYMEGCRKAAKNLTLPLIDHMLFWEQRTDRHFYWMSNAFHPNEYGHRAFAFCLFAELGIGATLPDRAENAGTAPNNTCRLFLP